LARKRVSFKEYLKLLRQYNITTEASIYCHRKRNPIIEFNKLPRESSTFYGLIQSKWRKFVPNALTVCNP